MSEPAEEAESSVDEAPPPPPDTPLRDTLEALTVAVIMALVLKQFLVEAYKIPTGSMQPTLMGLEAETAGGLTALGSSGVFDRILVDKLSYTFRDPLRWEVAVFRYPLDRSKNFVKRIVGLPGEELRIAHGDVWVRSKPDEDWHIARRPYAVQREMWKRLDRLEPEESSWIQVGGRANPWTVEGRAMRARGDGEARFGASGPVLDWYDDGYDDVLRPLVPRKRGENLVGDLRIESAISALPGCSSVELVLHEGEHEYAFVLPGPAAAEDATPSIEVRDPTPRPGPRNGATIKAPPWRLPAERTVQVAAQNLDNLLELFVDGEPLLALEVETASRPAAAALVRVTGEGAELSEVMVLRDIYYTSDRARTSQVLIPEGHYFVLGDNTQDSADSREWVFFRRDVPDGLGGIRELRGWKNDEHGRPNPSRRVVSAEGESEIWMVDEWGERWSFPDREVRIRPDLVAPFVPRELIRGRALAVFWPVIPWRKLVRLKWIH